MKIQNPIVKADFPYPDVIRVGDSYYMIGATMHFFPGGEILRSYDLQRWEFAGCVFERLDSSPEQTLGGEQSIYGKGMGAPSLRYHDNRFYVCFSAPDTGKTYIYTADAVAGPWKRKQIEGVYPHGSLLFDEDGSVYLAWGTDEIRLTELCPDFSGRKQGGADRVLVKLPDGEHAGLEGAHFYKINGSYYLFLVRYSKRGRERRVQMCFRSERLDGEFLGEPVFEEQPGFRNGGTVPEGISRAVVPQGGVSHAGIVDTPDGGWYSVMMQDHGAAGRLPVLAPVTWRGKRPVFGKVQKLPECLKRTEDQKLSGSLKLPQKRGVADGSAACGNAPFFSSEIFCEQGDGGEKAVIHPAWQWNHEPNERLWRRTDDGGLAVRTGKISMNVMQAANTLTQRVRYPSGSMEVSLDATDLGSGDYAGICAFQGLYSWIGITKDIGRYFLVMHSRRLQGDPMPEAAADYMPGTENYRVLISENIVRLKMKTDFTEKTGTAEFFFFSNGEWMRIGTHRLFARRDHLMGCRYGLFVYSTRKIGGEAVFYNVSC